MGDTRRGRPPLALSHRVRRRPKALARLPAAAAAVLLVALGACGTATSGQGATKALASGAGSSPTTATFPPAPTKTSGCRIQGALPDSACTPGELNAAVTQADTAQTICTSGFTATIRPATTESDRLKKQVARAYGITDSLSHYQGDHLIPLELGGAADDAANFWDQPNQLRLADGTVVTSDQKDSLENTLKARVCGGQMTLVDAQRAIATDWYAAWAAFVRPAGSSAAPGAPTTTTSTRVPPTSAPSTTTARPAAPTVVTAATPASATTVATVAAAAPATTPAQCPNGSYINVSGNRVCSPYAASTAPPGATAICNDGTYSMSQHRQGTCSGHGGVRAFLANLP